MRVTAADLDERRILAPARRLIERLPALEKNRSLPRRQANKDRDLSLEKLKRAQAPRETAIQRQIIDLLTATPGFEAWKAGSGLLPVEGGRRVRMGKAGVADVIGYVVMHMIGGLGEMRWCRRPKGCYFSGHVPVWIAVEVKRPKRGKPPTPAQLAFLARLRDAGSPLAMVAHSVDEVRRAVEAL